MFTMTLGEEESPNRNRQRLLNLPSSLEMSCQNVGEDGHGNAEKEIGNTDLFLQSTDLR